LPYRPGFPLYLFLWHSASLRAGKKDAAAIPNAFNLFNFYTWFPKPIFQTYKVLKTLQVYRVFFQTSQVLKTCEVFRMTFINPQYLD
jgi:replication initiation and membrane attachment protein DnaB